MIKTNVIINWYAYSINLLSTSLHIIDINFFYSNPSDNKIISNEIFM